MDVWALFVHRVPYVVGAQPAIVDALDWTEFDAAGHAAIALSLVTSHGRATPVVWQTVPKTQLKGRRNQYEDAVLQRLHDALPAGVEVTVLADRGFGDQTLYHFLTELGFVCIVRFRSAVTVTQDVYPLDAVVCVKARQTKEPSCLAVRGPARPGAAVVKPYGRRFTIEETFREVGANEPTPTGNEDLHATSSCASASRTRVFARRAAARRTMSRYCGMTTCSDQRSAYAR